MLAKAMRFAAYKHQFQKRKSDGSSYIVHPFRVEEKLEQAGVEDENILCGAVLHDTVEDTNTTLEEINKNFNWDVEILVASVTDDKSLPKVERKKLQIEKVNKINAGSLLIKLADKLDNLGDIQTNPPSGWCQDMIDGYIIWSRAVVETIKQRYERHFKGTKLAPSFCWLFYELDKIFHATQWEQSGMTLKKYYETIEDYE